MRELLAAYLLPHPPGPRPSLSRPQVNGSAAALCMSLSLVFGLLALQSLRRVQNIDKFEKEIKGR